MKLPDGRELLLVFAYPLSLRVVPQLMEGIAAGAEKAGYSDVVFLFDGPHAGGVAATPPEMGR